MPILFICSDQNESESKNSRSAYNVSYKSEGQLLGEAELANIQNKCHPVLLKSVEMQLETRCKIVIAANLSTLKFIDDFLEIFRFSTDSQITPSFLNTLFKSIAQNSTKRRFAPVPGRFVPSRFAQIGDPPEWLRGRASVF